MTFRHMHPTVFFEYIAAFSRQLSEFEQQIVRLEAELLECLHKSDRRYTSLAEAAPVGIFRTNVAGELVYVNERWCQIAGIRPEQAQGHGWIQCLHPADRETIVIQWQQTIQESQLFQQEYRFLSPSGQTTWVLGLGGPETDANGHVMGYVGSITDISDRKDMEQALKNSEERLQEAQRIAHIGSWESDSETGTLLSWSAETYRIFEVEPASVDSVNDIFVETLHPDDRNNFYQALANAIQNNAPFEMIHRLQFSDLRIKYVQSRAQIFYSAEGKAIRAVGTIQDITTQHLSEMERQETESWLQTFIEGTAAVTGANFFPELVRYTANVLGVRSVLVTQVQKHSLMPLAWWVDGHFQANQRLSYTDTPCCVKTLQKGLYCVPLGIQRLYPQHPLLEAIDAQSYLGIGLRNSANEIIGTLCIFDDRPLSNTQQTQGILRAFAARAGAELERLQTAQQLEQLNAELEHKVATRTAKLQEQESQLRELSARLALSLKSGAIGYWEWDITRNHLIWDDLMFKLNGLAPLTTALTYETWFNCIHPSDRALTEADIQQALKGEKRLDTEFRVVHADGTIRAIKSYGFVQRDTQGKPQTMIGINFDISDRKEYEKHLQQTNAELARATRLKDEFLANMSHELRTPLNAILGMADGLAEDVFGSLNEQQRKAVQTIEHSGTHLLELINDILDLSKIEAGKLELELTAIPIHHLCDTSLAFVRQLAFKKDIHLSCDILQPLQSLHIYVDELRIRQVLINLLNNAVKFTPKGGKVTLSVHLDVHGQALEHEPPPTDQPYQICFRVSDTGIGIASEHISQLFQAFMQIDSSLTRQYSGTGLGLALVKRFVELHHGTVAVTSQVGQRSCFSVNLPCYPASELTSQPVMRCGESAPSILSDKETHTPSSGTSQGLQGSRILLVEDNPLNRESLTDYLESQGCHLVIAEDGQQALRSLENYQPDLIIMDLHMPVMDGFQTIQEIRQRPRCHQIPLIALSAFVMSGEREKSLLAGANIYLAKPVKMKELVATIKTFLLPTH